MAVRTRPRAAALAGLLVAVAPFTMGAAQPGPAVDTGRADLAASLPLGSKDLPETRSTQRLAAGVALTTIVRGRVAPGDHWTVDVAIPAGELPPSPDPDAPSSVLGTRDAATAVAARLTAAGYRPSVVEERNPAYADLPAGTQGFTVQVGRFPDPAGANALVKKLKPLGFKGVGTFSGGERTQTDGPWVLHELVIDPHRFTGRIEEFHGDSQTGRRTTSELAALGGALAAVNGGYFVMDPAAGAPGQPIGAVVEHGRLLHEATGGRIAAILRDGGRRVEFTGLRTTLLLRLRGGTHTVAGLNRSPGLIPNCGQPGDRPSPAPLMDVTCTKPDETVVLTPEYGSAPPAGPGAQAVLDPAGTVVSVGPRDGRPVPAGDTVVQSIGTEADWLTGNLPVGSRVSLEGTVTDGQGHEVRFGPDDSVIAGGPKLLTGGTPDIRPVADGLVHPGDPSYFYGWGVRRNPRTAIGTDRAGRIILFQADGRRPGYSQGLSLDEEAGVLRAFGATDAMNLDGGGSSAMYTARTGLVGRPSDPTGERPVGNALLVLPSAARR
ncbi:phosphodiester glycosidase family protein [Kitasatospora cystarginea]|uniref:Phosphodiester glycosidase family protein n=1 Tax=Kitasatospora cystarginea TaxID=58350 RepID=A0ABN3DQA3_9ACTN